MKLVGTFPVRSGCAPDTLTRGKLDYPCIRRAALSLLGSGHIDDVLAATYARVFVDEYQDCSVDQHGIISEGTKELPACVLGDPMQAIFDFRGNRLVGWESEVESTFPAVGTLTTPWRWRNAGTGLLGDWLLDARTRLEQGRPIDVRTAQEGVIWVQLDGTNDRLTCLKAVRQLASSTDGRVLVIGDSTNAATRQEFASQTHGATTVEPVDLKDLFTFADAFRPQEPNSLATLAKFAQSAMTNLGTAAVGTLLPRITSLQRGAARKPPTPVENAALLFAASRDFQTALGLLSEIRKQPGVRAHRPEVLRACIKALQLCGGADRITLQEAVTRVREQHRFASRPLPKLAVGSTLLLKGQEAEAVVILNAGGLNARNLYVAMTRGSRTVTVCSRYPVLKPPPA